MAASTPISYWEAPMYPKEPKRPSVSTNTLQHSSDIYPSMEPNHQNSKTSSQTLEEDVESRHHASVSTASSEDAQAQVAIRVANAFNNDPIVQRIVSERSCIDIECDPIEIERRQRMYNMIRHSNHYKKMQIESANTKWTDDIDAALEAFSLSNPNPEEDVMSDAEHEANTAAMFTYRKHTLPGPPLLLRHPRVEFNSQTSTRSKGVRKVSFSVPMMEDDIPRKEKFKDIPLDPIVPFSSPSSSCPSSPTSLNGDFNLLSASSPEKPKVSMTKKLMRKLFGHD